MMSYTANGLKPWTKQQQPSFLNILNFFNRRRKHASNNYKVPIDFIKAA